MKFKFLLTVVFCGFFTSHQLYCQKLYVPGGTGGIGYSPNENVGIGTATPVDKLDVAGSINLNDNLILSGTNKWIFHTPDDGRNNLFIARYNNNDWDWARSTVLNGDGSATVNGNLVSNGNITAKELSIYSDESSGGWGLTHLYWKGHTLFMGSPRGAWVHNAITFRPGGSNSPGEVCQNYFSIEKAIGVDNYETCIQFATDGTINYIKNGNVLIGKTAQKDASFKLDVAGKIRANEIVVNTDGADFVFEPTYKLRTLPELETFIKEHKHLPEIAPAKEMQENGVSAGEMQAKLLQKVEELTLYVIELKKENEKLEIDKNKELDELRNDIKELKNMITKTSL